MKERILVFIPCYNCMNQITRVIDQFTPDILDLIDNVLIINNQSTDQTQEVVINHISNNPELIEKFIVLRNHQNYGLGGSHKVAFNYATENDFDFVIILHGDDQGSIKDIIHFIKEGKHKNVDALLGARFHPQSTIPGYSAFRTFGNKVFNLLFSISLFKTIYDLGSGLNCYKVAILKNRFFHKFPDDLTFNYCMVMAHARYNHNIDFFPITWREDDQISNVKLFPQAQRVLTMLLKYTFLRKLFLISEMRNSIIDKYDAKIVLP